MNSSGKHNVKCLGLAILCGLCFAGASVAQSTSFTYQGKLSDTGSLANASYDFQVKLFDTPTVGTGIQQGGTVTVPAVQVTNGIFTVNGTLAGSPMPAILPRRRLPVPSRK